MPDEIFSAAGLRRALVIKFRHPVSRWLFKCWPAERVTHCIASSTVHDCRPCGRAGCNDSKVSECLTTLPVAQVLVS
jgi:hypothetical protein